MPPALPDPASWPGGAGDRSFGRNVTRGPTSSPVTIALMTRSRYAICSAAVMMAALLPTVPADAAVTLRCRSADLRYPFMPGGPNDFGVFRLRITGGSCTTAHRIAKAWMTRFEANLRAGHVRLPRRVEGFTFTTLRPIEAQTYRERGRRSATTIRFDYRVPNG